MSSCQHSHSFLGSGHDKCERKNWAVIWLCAAMMIAEILGGLMFGSIALMADGLHMSTHAGALLLAALAYSYSRKHVDDCHRPIHFKSRNSCRCIGSARVKEPPQM